MSLRWVWSVADVELDEEQKTVVEKSQVSRYIYQEENWMQWVKEWNEGFE